MTGISRSAARRVHLAQQTEPVELRHHDVGEHQIDGAIAASAASARARSRPPRPTIWPSRCDDVLAHVRVVVGEQDRAPRRRALGLARQRIDRRLPEGASAGLPRRTPSRERGARRRRHRATRSGGRWAVPRNRHGEGRAFAGCALGHDGSAVQLHQLLHQREADARAFVGPRRARPRRGGSARTRAAARPPESPTPVSSTVSTTLPCSLRSAASHEITPRRSVNLNAFESRFRTIFSHISPIDVDRLRAAVAQSTSKRSPPRSIAERNVLARSAVSAARSVGS